MPVIWGYSPLLLEQVNRMAQALWILRLPVKAKIFVSSGEVISLGDKLAERGKKKYLAPATGKIVRVSKREIELQFKAKKIAGRGIGKGHCWGEVVVAQDFTQLNIACQGKIAFLKQINNLIIAKAKTLGVRGLICLELNGELKSDHSLPVLLVADESKLALALKEVKGVKCLLEAEKGYLLIPSK